MTNEQRANTLREKAATLDKRIAHHLRDRQTNTRKRAQEDQQMRREGKKLQTVQAVMRALAAAWEIGTVPAVLKDFRSISQFESTVGCVLSTERHVTEYPNGAQMRDRYSPEDRAIREVILTLDSSPLQESQAEKLHRMERDIKLQKIPGFFATPKAIVERMLEAAGPINAWDWILEPSAGTGAIADEIVAAAGGTVNAQGAPKLFCYERHASLRAILQMKPCGSSGVQEDFLESSADHQLYHKIVMNPPFEGMADIDHVAHAYKMLRPGGVLVSIMSPSVFFRDTEKARGFQTWFRGIGGTVEDLPSGTFEMTGVPSKLIVVHKPGELPKAVPVPKAERTEFEEIQRRGARQFTARVDAAREPAAKPAPCAKPSKPGVDPKRSAACKRAWDTMHTKYGPSGKKQATSQ
jgi:hypothetical protein